MRRETHRYGRHSPLSFCLALVSAVLRQTGGPVLAFAADAVTPSAILSNLRDDENHSVVLPLRRHYGF